MTNPGTTPTETPSAPEKPDPLTSLDPDETTLQEPFQPASAPTDLTPPDFPNARHDLNQTFRHSFWRQKREAIGRVLHAAGRDQNRAKRYATCGTYAWVLRVGGANDRFRIVTNRCRDRFCEACQKERKNIIGANLRACLPEAFMRFMTLTLKSTDQPLTEVLSRLIKSFGQLRRRKEIAERIDGGVWFLEITRNVETGRWHPHLHVLFQGTFIPQQILRRNWLDITKDSFIVDIRALRDSKQAAEYVCKYASKGCDGSVWHDEEALTEAMDALSARRTFSVFGSWKNLDLSKPPTSDEEWEPVAPLWRLILDAQDGDEIATMILSHLKGGRDEPLDAGSMHDPPNKMSDL